MTQKIYSNRLFAIVKTFVIKEIFIFCANKYIRHNYFILSNINVDYKE